MAMYFCFILPCIVSLNHESTLMQVLNVWCVSGESLLEVL